MVVSRDTFEIFLTEKEYEMNKKIAVLIISFSLVLGGCSEKTTETISDRKSGQQVFSGMKGQMKATRNLVFEDSVDGVFTSMASPVIAPAESMMSGPLTMNRESYDNIDENGFIASFTSPLSTFSIDVDTASYANVRRLINDGLMPPVGAVRVEEMVNYFTYGYPEPKGKDPMRITIEAGPSPYNKDYKLVQIGIRAKDIADEDLPPSNLVFLVDVSGSMDAPNKLGLLKKSIKMLTSTLGKDDRVSIVVYAGADRVVLEPTSGDEKKKIDNAIEQLTSGGSTHASRGIITAYKLARQVFIPGGNNRVILASDGDFNVGVTSRGELQKLIEKQKKSKVYLTVLGFGSGNYHDDTMEVLADKGNGNYGYIDSLLEAKKILLKERGATLFTLAEDVKIQVEFNPARVGAYRLIGYENRKLNNEDFRDDKKDAGEIGSGHTVTALYELIPAGHKDIPKVDKLKYQQVTSGKNDDELMTVKLRYKPKGTDSSREIASVLNRVENDFEKMSGDFRFASAVAGFGMLLRESDHAGDYDWEKCLETIKNSRGSDPEGYRAELFRLVEMAGLMQKDKERQ